MREHTARAPAGRDGCALVTGASRGIGAAIAVALAEDGWPVGVHYCTDTAGAERTARAIETIGGRAHTLEGDVGDASAIEGWFTDLEARFGRVAALVNNAGIRSDALTLQLDDAEWDRVVAVNLSAVFRITRRAVAPMLRARHGRIISIASIVGPRANPGQSNYAAAKAGLIGLTRTLAAEIGRRGVTVNAVAPGFIDTDMTEGVVGPELLARVPARRIGTPQEVAACVRFLASEVASYVTGTTLTVDGGLTA